jgi:hypothetical protein
MLPSRYHGPVEPENCTACQAAAILRLEHRVDDSRGPGGGFFSDGEAQPGVASLRPTQHLLMLGVILTYDASFHH